MNGTFFTLMAIAISTVSSDKSKFFLYTEHRQLALSIQTIVDKYFTKGRTILVSTPSVGQHTGRPLSLSLHDNNLQLVSFILKNLHENVSWPLQMYPPQIMNYARVDKTHSYIVFTWPQEEDNDALGSLTTQIETLKQEEGALWNPRGKFLVVVTDTGDVPPRELGLQIYTELWKEHFIIDNTILVARGKHMPINGTNYTEDFKRDTLEIYSGFPYETGKCGEVTDVTLLDQWHIHNETFLYNTNLFPTKLADNFLGCPITVDSVVLPPYIILTGNNTDSDGNVEYKLSGLAVQNLLLASDKMNTTINFLEPILNYDIYRGLLAVSNLAARETDIVIGTVPLVSNAFSSIYQPTIPYTYTSAKWFVPCPKPVSRMEKVLTTFKLPVWLTMVTVFITTSIVWWCLANWKHSCLKFSRRIQTLSHCVLNAWAVFIGVSVSIVPKTWKFRFLFIFYVCYCFSMSTVFQAFFITYLVEPGYGNKYESFEEVLHSSLVYGYNDAMEGGFSTISYEDLYSFPSSRRQECNNMTECLERIANNAQLCTISDSLISEYLANEIGIHDSSKYLCTLEENLITVGFSSLVSNGSPFLDRINIMTRRSLEGGLLGRYMAELNWLTNLRSKSRIRDDNIDSYFVFSLSHLNPAFCILVFGYVFSTVVFLIELLLNRIPNLNLRGIS